MQLAGAMLALGKTAEAEEQYRPLLKLYQKVFGKFHASTLICEMNLGCVSAQFPVPQPNNASGCQ